MTGAMLDAKYAVMRTGKPAPEQAAAWNSVVAEIDRFLACEKLLLSVPMWNFSIPYMLKKYIDVITQPGSLFTWTPENGYQGLLQGRSAAVVFASSFDYSKGTSLDGYDYGKTYLEHWLRLIGVENLHMIDAGPTFADTTPTAIALKERAI